MDGTNNLVGTRVKIAIFILSFFAMLFCMVKSAVGYNFLFLLPLSFILCFGFILYPVWSKTGSKTVAFIIITAILRYVILPILYSVDPCYNVNDLSIGDSNSLTNAIVYMCYELFFIGLFIRFFFAKNTGYLNIQNQYFDIHLTNNIFCYIYILFCFFMVLTHPSIWNNINFISLQTDTSSRAYNPDINTVDLIVRQFFQVGLLLLFTVLVGRWSEKYRNNYEGFYFFISLLLALCIVSIIIGEKRDVQVYVAFSTIVFLCKNFPDKKRTIITSITAVVVVVITFLTIYKTFYAFNTKSYSDALSLGLSSGFSLSYEFEVYVLGPVSVAAAFQLPTTFEPGIGRLLFDFTRSIIGPSFIVKNINFDTTTMLYNRLVSGGYMTNGFLLPISAQGAIYLTPIFGPILICIYYRISFFLEKVINNTVNPYICVFSSYLFIRFSTCMIASNINTINTVASLTLLFLLPMLFYNRFIGQRV